MNGSDYKALMSRVRQTVGEHYSNCGIANCPVCDLWDDLLAVRREEEEREKREKAEADRQEEINLGKQVMGDD